jgi:hypothetical protein
VLASVAAPAPRRRPWWQVALPLAVAAAAVALLWWRARPTEPRGPELAMAIERASEAIRGDALRLGDKVRFTVAGGRSVRALWIYRGASELVLACPADPACEVKGEELIVTFAPRLVGEHRVVAVWSSEPLPAPRGSLDEEAAAALRAGATIERRTLWVD